MEFRFHFARTLQAVGVLLEYEKSRRMSYMRLLKLLYIADRELLGETGRPLTGDRALAMKRGPVPRRVRDLILGQAPAAGQWDNFVHTDRYEVELVADPGRGELSKGEVAKLLDVSKRYRDMDEWQLSEETHTFAEWKKHFPGGDQSADIPWQDVLVALGRGDWVEAVAADEADRQFFDSVFGGEPCKQASPS
jgi:uncharacterized phage-associated protein